MLEIRPVKKTNYDCFQTCMVTLAEYWNRGHIFMLADSWGFSYINRNVKQPFGERISPDHYQNANYLLDYYHGINCSWKLSTDLNEVFAEVHNQLVNSLPLILVIDSFWCPWLLDFQKVHIQHYCIITGVNLDTGDLHCLDPYYSDKCEVLKFSDLSNGYIKLLTFKLNVSKELDDIDYKFLLSNYALKVLNKNNDQCPFEQMRQFADDVDVQFDITREVGNFENIESVPLFFKLKLLESGRRNISELLLYICNSYHVRDLKGYSDKMEALSDLWRKVRLYIIKLSMSNTSKNSNRKVSQALYEIIDYERSVANELEQWLN
jgi:hypothetical protein